MKFLTTLILSGLVATFAAAQAAETPVLEPIPAADVALADLLWLRRPIVVFADSPSDPAFQTQLRYLAEDPGELIKRDVVILTDTDPKTLSEAREKLRPRGFSIVLLDKDGKLMLRKPLPWTVREIIHAIDKFPLRQQEIREGRAAN